MSDWTPLHARLHQTLRQRQLLPRRWRILVAVSGGQDSICLLKLLLDLQPKWEWEIAIAHCDHRWSSDAGISDHVQEIAQAWKVPFYLRSAEHVNETEAAAREWRYKILVEIAEQARYQAIVAGHTQSDLAETLLYNLIRGSGADGLQALGWQRLLSTNIHLVRPLLNVSRSETLYFCQQFGLPIWEDAVNQNLKYARNRIRNHLIPYLKTQFNPQVETALAQTAELLRAEVEYLENVASQLLQQAINAEHRYLNRAILNSVPLALQRRVVRQCLQPILNQSPNFTEIEAVVTLINAPNRTRTSSLPRGVTAEVQGDWIAFIS